MRPRMHRTAAHGVGASVLLVLLANSAVHSETPAAPGTVGPILQVDASRFPRIAVFLDAASGAPAPTGLAAVLEDGRPLAVAPSERRLPPMALLVLVDIPPDRAEWLPGVDALLRWLSGRMSPQDSVATLTPAEPDIGQSPFRRARSALLEVAQVGQPGAGRLHDAMAAGWIACRRHTGRAAILVLAAGPDRGSLVREAELRRLMAQGPFPVFSAALGSDEATARLLADVSAGSGGASVALEDPKQVLESMVPLLERLFTAPVVWYRTANSSRDGGWRSVSTGPPTERAQRAPTRGYFAPASPDLCRSLDLEVTGERDRALRVPYVLTSQDGQARTAGYTGEAELAYPGAYHVRLLGGPIPEGAGSLRVSTSRETQTVLVARMAEFILWGPPETAGLTYTVYDERTGEEVAEGVVARSGGDGARAHRVCLPPGRYHIHVPEAPLDGDRRVDVDLRQVAVEAGVLVEMDLSARGVLLLTLEDYLPGVDYPAPLAVYPLVAGDEAQVPESAVGHGFTNVPLDLPVGVYDVIVDTKPPIIRKQVEVSQGSVCRVGLPQLGAIQLRLLDTAGEPARASWFAEQEDVFVLSGRTNKTESVVPGVYSLTIDTQPRQRRSDCVVDSGGVYVEDIGQLAGLSVVLRGLSDESFIRRKFTLVDPSTAPIDPRTGARDPRDGVRIANGLSGDFTDVNFFLPDTYDVIVWTAPQTVLSGVSLEAGRIRTIDIGRLAGLRVDTGGEAVLRFAARRAEDGEVAGAYDAGAVVLVQPGTYRLEVVGGAQVELSEAVAVGALAEAGALFVDPGTVQDLSFSLSRADTGEPLGVYAAATRVELPEGEYALVSSVAEGRLPHTVRISEGVVTVVPLLPVAE